jgi:hypothetical protein
MAKGTNKPSPAMRRRAWKVLDALANDEDAGSTARAYSARAIVLGDKAEADAMAAGADRKPPVVLEMPHNFRDEAVLGITHSESAITILYDAGTEAGLANLARWRAEVGIEIEAAFAPAPILLTPPSKGKSAAQRQREYRERKRAAMLTGG